MECKCGATRFRFNLNNNIKFKPTELGQKIYSEHWAPYRDGKLDEMETDNEGYAEMQLHQFMRIFGPEMHGGYNLSVGTNVIFIDNLEEDIQKLEAMLNSSE